MSRKCFRRTPWDRRMVAFGIDRPRQTRLDESVMSGSWRFTPRNEFDPEASFQCRESPKYTIPSYFNFLVDRQGCPDHKEACFSSLVAGASVQGATSTNAPPVAQAKAESASENANKLPIHPLLTLKDKPKRGRRRKDMPTELIEAYTQRRLERNRVHAKENREKKKKYIAELEAEVTCTLQP